MSLPRLQFVECRKGWSRNQWKTRTHLRMKIKFFVRNTWWPVVCRNPHSWSIVYKFVLFDYWNLSVWCFILVFLLNLFSLRIKKLSHCTIVLYCSTTYSSRNEQMSDEMIRTTDYIFCTKNAMWHLMNFLVSNVLKQEMHRDIVSQGAGIRDQTLVVHVYMYNTLHDTIFTAKTYHRSKRIYN